MHERINADQRTKESKRRIINVRRMLSVAFIIVVIYLKITA